MGATNSHKGEGNGTPLQYSCLEHPMDGGAWWAAVHEVARSQTRLSWLHLHFSLSCIGEGNGNPLQYSCLENSRDGGAWWAAIYGVTQSQTWLKRLSSSSSSNSHKRRKWQPTPVFLLGEFHGQKSLVGYSPWGHKESDMTEWLTLSTLVRTAGSCSGHELAGCAEKKCVCDKYDAKDAQHCRHLELEETFPFIPQILMERLSYKELRRKEYEKGHRPSYL